MPLPEVDTAQVKREPVCIIGGGPSGLVTAQVFLRDGFQNVQVLCRDPHVGGVWSRDRIYPNMTINNVDGEFRFSAHPMTPPPDSTLTGGRLRGIDVCRYMEEFHEKHLRIPSDGDAKNEQPKSIVRFNAEAVKITRSPNSKGWDLLVKDTVSGETETLYFPRIVLCTGGASVPVFAEGLAPKDAVKAGFTGPVFHSSDAWPNMMTILDSVGVQEKPDPDAVPGADGHKSVVVIGGGKSAQDFSAYIASQGVPVTVVYNKLEIALAVNKPLPRAIRQSRLMSVFSPHITLNTRIERFLHTTAAGAKMIRKTWERMEEDSHDVYRVPKASPLRITRSLFWDVRSGDEGVKREDSFVSLVMKGKIKVVAPTYVSKYTSRGVETTEGEKLDASAIIVATGYGSSWNGMLDDATMLEIGLSQRVDSNALEEFKWNYTTLNNPPDLAPVPTFPDGTSKAPGLYRASVPAKTIDRRDIAVNGTMFTSSIGYTLEVCANWISAYFLGEAMRLPDSPEDATRLTLREFAWSRRRYPEYTGWQNPSVTSTTPFFCAIQAADEMLEDMYLPSMRSGGNWLTWLFKPISIDELGTLGEERSRKRGETNLNKLQ
ncbi:hypothetical protein DFP72DRAFT_819004 [Ephemerocybe angulata]|uniref:FAD/NAD(P)-binding domain-containing protein n=1 Tax=Ephemerocybe angulata TaxID=980116 RepID=A0A8H6M054_9AGAR|nr:hypothetical protein DFP72DRAFT_819004 [Tulosesus angulatus]